MEQFSHVIDELFNRLIFVQLFVLVTLLLSGFLLAFPMATFVFFCFGDRSIWASTFSILNFSESHVLSVITLSWMFGLLGGLLALVVCVSFYSALLGLMKVPLRYPFSTLTNFQLMYLEIISYKANLVLSAFFWSLVNLVSVFNLF